MSPPGKTSLFIEFFCWKDDEIWNMSKEDLFEVAITWLDKLDLVRREEVIDIFHIRKDNAYPVYDLNYKENLDIVKKYLDSIENLIYIGRPGRFKYTNQDHSLEMGILAARSIVDGRSYNIEDVGAEEGYFERGYAKTS
jgi:protoporphyrinogen oxidase